MKRSELAHVVERQRHVLDASPLGLEREALSGLPQLRTHALVVSGIRRCGKSTLLHQYVRKSGTPFFYINFEDIRLGSFGVQDYQLLDTLIAEAGSSLLFLDEVQTAPQWERFVRHKLDEGFAVVLTGSNASLLSRELGTALTGRHLQREVFPFSWHEYLRFFETDPNYESFERYLIDGGFPEYLKSGSAEILQQLQRDILARDIAVRFNLRDDQALLRLYTWLVSNAGNLMAPSRLTGVVGVKSATTVLEYVSHLEAAWMVHTVPRFAWSAKARALSPKKIYVNDLGFIRTSSLSSSRDLGSVLENMVFLELRRRTGAIHYLSENDRECDFVVGTGQTGVTCIQVCWELTGENEEREFGGLEQAMDFFDVEHGAILTANQTDQVVIHGKRISVVPAWTFDLSDLQ